MTGIWHLTIQVLGVVVLRIAQEVGSPGRKTAGGSEMNGRENIGGSELGGRGRKYETGDGCTNRAFSGQPNEIIITFHLHCIFGKQ